MSSKLSLLLIAWHSASAGHVIYEYLPTTHWVASNVNLVAMLFFA